MNLNIKMYVCMDVGMNVYLYWYKYIMYKYNMAYYKLQ